MKTKHEHQFTDWNRITKLGLASRICLICKVEGELVRTQSPKDKKQLASGDAD